MKKVAVERRSGTALPRKEKGFSLAVANAPRVNDVGQKIIDISMS